MTDLLGRACRRPDPLRGAQVPTPRWPLTSARIRSHVVVVIAVRVVVRVAAVPGRAAHGRPYEVTAQILITPLWRPDSCSSSWPFVRDPGDPPRSLQPRPRSSTRPRAAIARRAALWKVWNRAGASKRGRRLASGKHHHATARLAWKHRNDPPTSPTLTDCRHDSRSVSFAPDRPAIAIDARPSLAAGPRLGPARRRSPQQRAPAGAVRDNDPTISIWQVATVPPASPPQSHFARCCSSARRRLCSPCHPAVVIVSGSPGASRTEGGSSASTCCPIPLAHPALAYLRPAPPVRSPRRWPSQPMIRDGSARSSGISNEPKPGRHRSILSQLAPARTARRPPL